MRIGTRAGPLLGLAALLGILSAPVAVSAQSSVSNAPLSPDPQVLATGFESRDALRNDAVGNANSGAQYSAWLVESSRFIGVPFGGFMPDKAGPDAEGKARIVDFPVNVGILKGKDGKITLYDSGWMQQDYIFRWNAGCCATPLRDELMAMGLNPDDVTRIVIGHGHWDHAGQLDQFQNAVLYVQREELRAIDWALNYPEAKISAWNTMALGTQNFTAGGQPYPLGAYNNTCARTPACGYPPKTVMQIASKIMSGMSQVVDGRFEVAPGLIIHPAFRGHTYGAQLLQANTPNGQLVFGSDTYSSWEGIRDWNVANIQQTDTVQQFLAYEKCYLLTGTPTNQTPQTCIAAHERLSYSDDYPITKFWWNLQDQSGKKLNCSRAAELSLANAETSHIPSSPDKTKCESIPSAVEVAAEPTNPGLPGQAP
jgi:glyoxylase-like metal-dependent hydrolase (beta-lactamase superfamily II)